jgi:hypothetical protein
MPYIKQTERDVLEQPDRLIKTVGQLNYSITAQVHHFIEQYGKSYGTINAAIGVLECAKLELYRMIAAPYEDKKRLANGPVSELDDDSKRRMR